jgi:UDP-GlcNAc:undecaprenyl-phosphate/decaprenyl-phosphate GlcNAc-1-phosphate transferase
MSGSVIILLALIGFTTSWVLIPVIQRYLKPSPGRQLHHTHQQQVSRFGGLAIVAAFVVVAAIAFCLYPVPAAMLRDRVVVVISSLAIFALGFWDDLTPLGAKRKLAGQILIASPVYSAGIHIAALHNPLTGATYTLGVLSYFATVFWLIAFTNLVNLIDGVDGLAGGICLMVMGLLLYIGCQSNLVFPAICASAMCGALLGFLYYNFPPARIYLGDGGAYFLGFLIGILSMVHSHKGSVVGVLIAPLVVLALPIADVSLAIVRRGLKGLPVFRPDRQHLHHRLAEVGLSRTRIVLLFYGCTMVFLVFAFGILLLDGRWLPFLFGAACLVLLASARSFSFSREWFAIGKVVGNSLEVRKETRYALAMGRWLELEAERTPVPEELWTDFGFFSRKLGFTVVTLSTPEGHRHWNWTSGANGIRKTGIHRHRYELPTGDGSTLEFMAPASAFELKTFELLSELATETWVNASRRWQNVHQKRLVFQRAEHGAPNLAHRHHPGFQEGDADVTNTVSSLPHLLPTPLAKS